MLNSKILLLVFVLQIIQEKKYINEALLFFLLYQTGGIRI